VYKVQRPVYFINKVFNESKARYLQVQKLIYAILIISRKLKHYFDGYRVVVKTNFPLGVIIRNKDANRRIIKWEWNYALIQSSSRVARPSSLRL
jgi:hypothetical protein